MSETRYKLFPRYFRPTYTDKQIMGAINMLTMTAGVKVTYKNFGSVQFIDCGEGLEHIFCLWCGREMDMGCWQALMSKAYDGKAFGHLGFRTPCCNVPSALNELIYVKPCGFATFVIEVHNPIEMPCDVEVKGMSKAFGHDCFFRMISAHI